MFIPSHHMNWAIAGLFGLLAIGTCFRLWMLRGRTDPKTQSHLNSLRSWWALAIVLSVAILLENVGVIALLAVVGALSLWEFLRILGWKRVGKATSCVVFGLAAVYYFSLPFGFAEQTQVIAPIVIVLVLGAFRACLGLVEDFIAVTAATIWGLLLFIYCLSHAYFLLTLPGLPEPWVGNLGWILYLVLLTETNDIAQALIGRQFGHNKIAPVTSPNKSLEGLVGGVLVTAVLAVLLAPWLTSLMQNNGWGGALLAASSGALISIFGFLGDINKSGIKRDVGIKDSGTLIPGQGGMMDRVDSLTFSAPVFYYFVKAVLLMNRPVT
jgi:phosphatidate cytidylyltransferase